MDRKILRSLTLWTGNSSEGSGAEGTDVWEELAIAVVCTAFVLLSWALLFRTSILFTLFQLFSSPFRTAE